MWDLCRLIWWVVVDLFRPRAKLEAEILVLRQQINVLRRTAPKKLLLSSIDRFTVSRPIPLLEPTIKTVDTAPSKAAPLTTATYAL
jgi:hypothetical protein